MKWWTRFFQYLLANPPCRIIGRGRCKLLECCSGGFKNFADGLGAQVNPSTASFANVTGTATLAGTVQVAFAPGSYATRQYTILHSGRLI
jgi:hypothetical protein